MLNKIIDTINRYWNFGSIIVSLGGSFSVKYMSIIDILGWPLVSVIGFIIFLVILNYSLSLKEKLFANKYIKLKDLETLYIFKWGNENGKGFIHEDFKVNKHLLETSFFHPIVYYNNNFVKIHFLLYFHKKPPLTHHIMLRGLNNIYIPTENAWHCNQIRAFEAVIEYGVQYKIEFTIPNTL